MKLMNIHSVGTKVVAITMGVLTIIGIGIVVIYANIQKEQLTDVTRS